MFKTESTQLNAIDAKLAAIKTQKARGLIEIDLRERSQAQTARFALPFFRIYRGRPNSVPGFAGPWFARPCPVTPRHGFVDSRKCESLEELRTVWDEARKADDQAEMVVMPLIEAYVSAVWSNGMLAIGPGHEGATSGHDCQVFPTVDRAPIEGPYRTITDSPFFEFVKTRGGPTNIVQLRNGPTVPKIKDYVPHKDGCSGDNFDSDGRCLDCGAWYEVVEVVEAEGDLIEWETRAKTFQPGTVVSHIGGNMASHYAVHCIQNHIPLFTSRVPAVGEKLAPTGRPQRPANRPAMLKGARAALTAKLDRHQAGLLMLAVLHNSSAFDLSDDLHAMWLGFGAGLGVRLGFSASIGEARHAGVEGQHVTRDAVYNRYWNDWAKLRKRMAVAQDAFINRQWGGAMGGKKWAVCLSETLRLYDALVRLGHEPHQRPYTEAELAAMPEGDRKKRQAGRKAQVTWERNLIANAAKDVVIALNRVVNAAHNTGTFLNKFISQNMFDLAAENPARVAVLILDTIWSVREFEPKVHALKRLGVKKISAGTTLHPKHGASKPANTLKLPKATKLQSAQVKIEGKHLHYDSASLPMQMHIQYTTDLTEELDPTSYLTADTSMSAVQLAAIIFSEGDLVLSKAENSNSCYKQLAVSGKTIKAGDVTILEVLI